MKTVASALSILALACSPEPAAVGLPEDFAALVPADATLLVQIRSIAEIAEEAESFRASAALDEEPVNARELLTTLLEPVGYESYAGSILLHQPIGLSMSLGDSAFEPTLTLIVPVKDPQQLMEQLARSEDGISTRASGSYVAISMGDAAAGASGAASPLLTDFPPGMFSMRADLGALIRAFRPFIDMGLEQFMPLMQEAMEEDPMPMGDPAELMNWYLKWIRDGLDSAERLEVALDVQEPDVTFELRLLNREGSPLALIARPERIDFAALAGKIDPDSAMQFLLSYELAGQFQQFTGIYDGMLEGLNQQAGIPPEVVAAFGAYLGSMKEILPMLGRDMAGSYGFGPDGVRIAVTVQAADPAGVAERAAALLRGPELTAVGLVAGPETRSEMAGRPSISWTQTMDFSRIQSLAAAAGTDNFLDPDQFDELSALLLGQGGMQIALMPGTGEVAVLAGGDPAWRAEMARRLTAGGKPDPELMKALAPLEGANPFMFASVDIAPLFRFVGSLAKAVGATDDDLQEISQLMGDGSSLRLSYYGGVQGPEMVLGARFDLAGFARLISSAD